MDLFSWHLSLKLADPPDGEVPSWWGRAAHQLLLSSVNHYDPALAERLHAGDGLRPFTVSSLLGHFPRGALSHGAVYRLRFTSITAELSAILEQAVLNGPFSPGREIELDRIAFIIHQDEKETQRTDEARASISYAELSARYLLAKEMPPRRIGLKLLSPTTFKSNEMHVPIPLPELVFGSLLERWNAFAPITFPPETRRYAAECLAITRYRLSTFPVPMKGGGMRVGAVGEVSYTSLNFDRYWMSVIGVLACFSVYAGIGAGVTNGMGQCQLIQG